MTVKSKRIIAMILMGIPVLVLITGGSMKIAGAEPGMVVQFLTRAGFGSHIKILGITELVIAGLLLYPKTNKIGFLLAGCYLGGAFCLELGFGQPPASAIFLAILWISMFLKNKAMFLVDGENA